MNTTASPTPWQFTGSSVVDANGRLVCVLAQRLMQAGIVDAICAAPEMVELLRAIEHELALSLPMNLVLDDVRAMLDRIGGAP